MLSGINQNKGTSGVYLFIYYYIFFCQGMYSNSQGALIPYLSEANHLPETDFSFLFMARTLGSLAGIALYKYIHSKGHRELEHKVLIGSGIVYLIFMVLFVEWGGRLGQWVCMSLTGGAYYTAITATNICILLIVTDKKGVQIIMGYALFGLGALLSPQLIGIFEEDAYFYLGFFYAGITVLCWLYPMPSDPQNEPNSPKRTDRVGSSKLQWLFIAAFFLIVGIELTTNGWIPSYAVMKGVCDKRQAANYGSIYYIIVIVMRLGVPKIPLSNTKKLRVLLVGLIISSVICLVLQGRGDFASTVMFGVISFGFTVSMLYPLALVVSSEYGVSFKPGQTANMMTATVFSSGCLTGLTGILMKYDTQLLFYAVLAIAACLLINFLAIFKVIQEQSIAPAIPARLQLKEILRED